MNSVRTTFPCRALIVVALVAALSGYTHAGTHNAERHQKYDEAWNAFIDGLQNARKTLIEQQLFAPPNQDNRVSAKGYRYLLDHLERMIEMNFRMTQSFPSFMHQ